MRRLRPLSHVPCLEPNVRFWVATYTKYPSTNGIVHDATDLNIVYGVIDLLPPDKPGSRTSMSSGSELRKSSIRRSWRISLKTATLRIREKDV